MGTIALIGLVGVASFLPRYLPLVVLRERQPSALWQRALGYAPVAVLAAIVAPSVLTPAGGWESPTHLAPYLAGTATTAVCALLSKRLLTSAVLGMVVFFALLALLGG